MRQILALMDLKIRLVFANIPVCMTLLMPVGLTLIARVILDLNLTFLVCWGMHGLLWWENWALMMLSNLGIIGTLINLRLILKEAK